MKTYILDIREFVWQMKAQAQAEADAAGRLDAKGRPYRVTLQDVADSIGISRQSLHGLMRLGTEAISVSMINRLCNAFGCEPGDLFRVAENDNQAINTFEFEKEKK